MNMIEGLEGLIDSVLTGNKYIKDTKKDVLITAFNVDQSKPIIFKSFENLKWSIIIHWNKFEVISKILQD